MRACRGIIDSELSRVFQALIFRHGQRDSAIIFLPILPGAAGAISE
jgi:hypothetical protein